MALTDKLVAIADAIREKTGKYYMQDVKIYRRTRDTVNPVYNALSELVGLYFTLKRFENDQLSTNAIG